MDAAVKTFFSSPQFAVAGASSDPAKFGHKGLPHNFSSLELCDETSGMLTADCLVFGWYVKHSLPVTPINPSASSIAYPAGSSSVHKTVATVELLEAPRDTALSVITPPKVTKQVLQQAKAAGLRAVWLQPGSFDSEILEWARKEWPDAAIGGEDITGSRGGEGWCVLVDGDSGLRLADRKDGKL